MEKTYCISDVHICDGRGPFYLSGNHDRLHRFLDLVANENLVIAGDLLEGWAYTLEQIMNGPNRDLIDRIGQKENVTLIPGNHDFSADELFDTFPMVREIMSIKEVYGRWIVHGHTLDPKLDSQLKLDFAEMGKRLAAQSEIPIIERISDFIGKLDNNNRPLMEKLEYRGNFLLGHSHLVVDYGWYLNCGYWFGGYNTYFILYEDGTYKLEVFDG